MRAMTDRHFELAKLLLQRGAKPECRDKAGKTPLLWAAYYGRLDLVKLMVAHGANPCARDDSGQDALILAQMGYHPDIAAFAAFLRSKGLTIKRDTMASLHIRRHIVARLPLKQYSASRRTVPATFALGAGPLDRALIIRRNGRQIAAPVTFESLFTGTALWTSDEASDIRYELANGYASPKKYRFFGLVTLKGDSYLGVRWYDSLTHVVFRLHVVGNMLELEVVEKSIPGYNTFPSNNVPVLQQSPHGELIFMDWDGVYRFLPNRTWRRIGDIPPGDRSTC
jgi:hypothetical protein